MDLDTYLSDFRQSDEWEIRANESIRVRSPRELGELLMFSRRTTLRFDMFLLSTLRDLYGIPLIDFHFVWAPSKIVLRLLLQ